MEQDTVILSLDRYNQLIDAERELKEEKEYPHTIFANAYGGNSWSVRTKDEAVTEITKLLNKETIEKNNARFILNNTVGSLKNMNIFQFLKWRKNQLKTQ